MYVYMCTLYSLVPRPLPVFNVPCWERIEDSGNIIGLADPVDPVDPIGGGAISIEPGGQFELSDGTLKLGMAWGQGYTHYDCHHVCVYGV